MGGYFFTGKSVEMGIFFTEKSVEMGIFSNLYTWA